MLVKSWKATDFDIWYPKNQLITVDRHTSKYNHFQTKYSTKEMAKADKFESKTIKRNVISNLYFSSVQRLIGFMSETVNFEVSIFTPRGLSG